MTQQPNDQPPPEVRLNSIPPAYDYAQGCDPRWRVKTITSNGACLGLSAFWIIQNATGKKFLPWLDPPKAASSRGSNKPILWEDPALVDIQNVMQQQTDTAKGYENPQFTKTYTVNKVDAYSTIIARASQVAKDRAGRLKTDAPPVKFLSKTIDPTAANEFVASATIAQEIIQKNCYILLGFFGQFLCGSNQNFQNFRAPSGGHAIAIWVDGPRITLFDPNYGEYLFQDTTSFVGAFEYLFDQQYLVLCSSAFLQRLYLA